MTTTLIDKRMAKTISDLQARRVRAQEYITNQEGKLAEKLAPHRNELQITEAALKLYGVDVATQEQADPKEEFDEGKGESLHAE